jgi:SAM-dependent methyltransferase
MRPRAVRPLAPIRRAAASSLNSSATRRLLDSITIDGASGGELEAYLEADFERFIVTFELLGMQSGRVLEVGANPYFLTTLLYEYSSLEIIATNSFDPNAEGLSSQTLSYEAGGRRVDRLQEYTSLNVERHAFPFPDGSFDSVLFCEVIEHLLFDPMHALREMNRVLRPGGTIVVTTPNVARIENIARIVAGHSIYDPYSGHGPYGRHNREFNRHELVNLLAFAGFRVVDSFTSDVHDGGIEYHGRSPWMARLLRFRHEDLGQYLFVKGSKESAPMNGLPAELFRSTPHEALISFSDIPAQRSLQ